MANLTEEQATELIENGSILRRLKDECYCFHKFSGTLDNAYYECATPTQHDLGLDKDTTMEEAQTAFITHFQEEEHKATPPTIEDSTDW